MHAARGLRDAEVQHARHAVHADEHVLRGHVAMHEAERHASFVDRFVGGMQAVQRFREDGHHDARRQLLLTIPRAPYEARERLAAHVLHDEEKLVLLHHDVERRDDVRVLDARREPRLVQEHRREFGIMRELRVQSLDRHGAEEAGGADEAPEMHRRHTARGDRVVDRIAIHDQRRLRAGRDALGRYSFHN